MNKLKYYGFDWDDNLVYMPTRIHLLKNGKKISVSTAEYAKIRMQLGNNGFQLLPNGESFCDFLKQGDRQFKIDSLKAKRGPSWTSLVQCINKANIFSIITARGHSRGIISDTVKEMIKSNHKGISHNSMSESMHFFLHHAKKNGLSVDLKEDEDILLKQYLDLLQFYPVSNENVSLELGINGNAGSPEKAKIQALTSFMNHVKETANYITHKDFSPPISVGFSDDDEETIRNIKDFLQNNHFGNKISPSLWNTSTGEVVRHHI